MQKILEKIYAYYTLTCVPGSGEVPKWVYRFQHINFLLSSFRVFIAKTFLLDSDSLKATTQLLLPEVYDPASVPPL